VRFVGLGPRFGVGVVGAPSPAIVADHVLFDGLGCMSPAGVFAARADLDAAAEWMGRAAVEVPPGPLAPELAMARRVRLVEARAIGRVLEGDGWAVALLPLHAFSPVSHPRLLQLYEADDPEVVAVTLAPWRALLGTVATDLEAVRRSSLGAAPRVCLPGRMQSPPLSRWHDGIDVLGTLWGAPLGPGGTTG
jgi:hypothetical protein